MFDWKPELGTRLHVVPLDGKGQVRVFEAPPFFTFHYINSFETSDGSALCFDFAQFNDPATLNKLNLEPLRTNSQCLDPSPVMCALHQGLQCPSQPCAAPHAALHVIRGLTGGKAVS